MKKLLLPFFFLSLFAKAQNVTIPDANFKAYLVNICDLNQDKEIQTTEAQTVKKIDIVSKGVVSLSGIEAFTALTELSCDGNNKLPSFDLNKNTALSVLRCSYCGLVNVDLSKNIALTSVSCDYNKLLTLDVSNNTLLKYLNCSNNQLGTLNLSKNTALVSVDCSNNQLTTLDVSGSIALQYLGCSINQIAALNLNNDTAFV